MKLKFKLDFVDCDPDDYFFQFRMMPNNIDDNDDNDFEVEIDDEEDDDVQVQIQLHFLCVFKF